MPRRQRTSQSGAHDMAFKPAAFSRLPGVLLYSLDQDVHSVTCKRPQVLAIAAQNRSARLGRSHDHGVDGGSAASQGAQSSCPPSTRLRKEDFDVTSLEELISSGITIRPAGEALDQDDAGNGRWPKALALQGGDHCQSRSRTLRKEAHASAVENEQRVLRWPVGRCALLSGAQSPPPGQLHQVWVRRPHPAGRPSRHPSLPASPGGEAPRAPPPGATRKPGDSDPSRLGRGHRGGRPASLAYVGLYA